MKVLFANVPFVKEQGGRLRTGPNAGSRWPFTAPGKTGYVPFPFYMAYAASYLRHHGIDADYYDGVALRHWDYDRVRGSIAALRPATLFLDTSTPVFPMIRDVAVWAKEDLGARVVLVGPHMRTYASELIQESYVDHCVVGEYEKPALDITRRGSQAHRIYWHDHLENIDTLDGDNFLPLRPLDYLYNYYDPSMKTPRLQLTVSTSRGCPFRCTFCQWPKVMNNRQYRSRRPQLVIDEIKCVIRDFAAFWRSPARVGDVTRLLPGHALDSIKSVARGRVAPRNFVADLQGGLSEIRSIFFDDDTWNVGRQRVLQLCSGLKEIGLPWTMMGRTDTSPLDAYDVMVDSGCVGMRFGVESFNQRLLDNARKRLDARRNYETIRYLITRFSGIEFHFTTMKNLPGETEADWRADLEVLNELKLLGERSRNVVHWQNSDCIAFPGTDLWEEMVAAGKGEFLRDFAMYDGSPQNADKLAEAVGWLGADYRPPPECREESGPGEPPGQAVGSVQGPVRQ